MLWLSEVLLQGYDIDSFEGLVQEIGARARAGEMFFRMDVRPPFPDTPESGKTRHGSSQLYAYITNLGISLLVISDSLMVNGFITEFFLVIIYYSLKCFGVRQIRFNE